MGNANVKYAAPTPYYKLISDGQTQQYAGADGSVVDVSAYDSLGNQQSQTGSYRPPVGYGDSLKTGTSLYDLSGDYYDPNTGQVTSAYDQATTLSEIGDIDSAEYTFPYVAMWARDRTVLKRNLSAVQHTAYRIIRGLEGEDRDQLSG